MCKSSKILFNESCDVPLDSITYHYEWKTIPEERVKNGQTRLVKVTKKVKVVCTLQTLKDKLCSPIVFFMKHKFRVHNQSKFSKYVRTNLNDDEVFIVVDFSENYQLKYSSEIQSRHFGASNEQLALHTGAYLAKTMCEDSSVIKIRTFCTVSLCNRHDAAAIWAHLLPIFRKIKEDHENVTRVHVMSDGPTKHIADGVGGTVKRTADSAVRLGKDVANIEQFLASVGNMRPLILQVEGASIIEVDDI
ncbi:hypothetical protein J6590_004429 [Homalodisca vitripennis]|nr:hypothetical protein J6590_004429 [Homalodisca vitripennis]